MRHRPVVYWLDYIRSLAGTDNPVLVIQGRCDTVGDQRPLPIPLPGDFSSLVCMDYSPKSDEKTTHLRSALQRAVRDVINRHAATLIGVGRVRLRRRLRKMLEDDRKRDKRRCRTLTPVAFQRICGKNGRIDDPEQVLKFLHASGVVFWRPDVFNGRIILDQSWALEAIYTLLDRIKVLPTVFAKGRSRASCWPPSPGKAATFRPANLSFHDGELRHLFSLPTPQSWRIPGRVGVCGSRTPAATRLAGGPEPTGRRPHSGFSGTPHAKARYRFLHEGVLRRFMTAVGENAGDSAIYWKFGCWFYDHQMGAGVLIDCHWDDASPHAWSGGVTLDAWGEQPIRLLERLVLALIEVSLAEKPEVTFTGTGAPGAGGKDHRAGQGAGVELDLKLLSLQNLPPVLQRKAAAVLAKPYGLDWLRTLCQVRRSGSQNRAAGTLGTTPQNVQRMMRDLRGTSPVVASSTRVPKELRSRLKVIHSAIGLTFFVPGKAEMKAGNGFRPPPRA